MMLKTNHNELVYNSLEDHARFWPESNSRWKAWVKYTHHIKTDNYPEKNVAFFIRDF